MARVYVGNLNSYVTELDLEDEFRAFGIIRSVWVAQRPSGYAFIDFEDQWDAQEAILELNGKHGWRVELSHNSSGGRGGRSGSSDLKCYECGEPGHFARECRLRVGSQRHRSPNPRYCWSPSNGGRSPTRACLRADQMDSEEQNDRIVELENQMSELKNEMNELKNLLARLIHRFDHIGKPLLPAPQAKATASASAPKDDAGSNGRLVLNDGPSDAPEVEELNPVIPEIVAGKEDGRSKQTAMTEEKLRLLQGLEVQGTKELLHYAKFELPEKFKMPKFNKYDGNGCPKVHLHHYMLMMARYAENVPLMIRTFQESLTGPALQWFFQQGVHMMDTWEELWDAFMRRFEFNTAFAPTRDDLVRMEKKRGESFRSYVQRWHSLASQASPALPDKEMIELFLRALPWEYLDQMIGSYFATFADLVMAGERLEAAFRDGIFTA